MQKWGKFYLAAVLLLGSVASAMAVEVSQAEWEAMKAQISDLQARNAGSTVVSSVDTALDSHYGPGQSVSTKTGKLTISGLVQVWYYSIQNDHRGFYDDPAVNAIQDDNSVNDNDGFRIRRAELKFGIEVHENVSAMIMIDPAREAAGFPSFPNNQGGTKKANQNSPELISVNDPGSVVSAAQSGSQHLAVQNGAIKGGSPQLLKDAYINYHCVVPHHDFQIGQFKPWVGEEGIRGSGELDFAERSMLGQTGDARDMGASVHGSWWDANCDSTKNDGRVQYWLGVFNGAGSYYDAPGSQENRANDNDYLDYNARLLVRPLWDDCAGHLELGASFEGGKKGEGGNRNPLGGGIGGTMTDLARPEHWAQRYNAWFMYKAGWELTGLWLRSEATAMWDRERPGTVLDVLGAGANGSGFAQDNGATYRRDGVYGAIGYHFGQSKMCVPGWLKGFEVLGRYDQFQNILVADAIDPRHTDAFYTKAWTGGINYYIKGHNAKIQANYNWVDNGASEHSNGVREFHNVRNDSFVVNFQVMF